MNSAWNSDDEKDMNTLAKDTLDKQKTVSDEAVKSELIKVDRAQSAPAAPDKSALMLDESSANYLLSVKAGVKAAKPETDEKDDGSKYPPKPLVKPLCKTNQDNTHDIMEPTKEEAL